MHPSTIETVPKTTFERLVWRRLLLGTLMVVTAILLAGPQTAKAADDQKKASPQAKGQTTSGESILSGYRGLVGREIRNTDNETIGQIEDVVADINGENVQAIVSVGGFWGIGDEEIIIPLDQFRLTKRRPYVFFNGTQEELTAYPNYREPGYRGARDRPPYGRYYPPRYDYGYRHMDRGPGSESAYYRDFGERDYRAYYGQGRMPGYQEGRQPTMGRPESSERQSGNFRAATLIGKAVQNANDQKIGEVEDVIIGRDGRINLVISVGGFLGIGEKQVRADLEDVDLSSPDDIVYDISKQELEQEPAYQAAQP